MPQIIKNDALDNAILDAAADFRAVSHAYLDGKRNGMPEIDAFLAAIRAYQQRHPEKSAITATHEAANLMRNLDRDAA